MPEWSKQEKAWQDAHWGLPASERTQNSGEEKKPTHICRACGGVGGVHWSWCQRPFERASNAQKPPDRGQGHPEYLKLLEERTAIHIEKSAGYGTGKDPMANFTAVAELTGMPRWVYPMLRAEEKIQRAWSLYKQNRFDEIEEEFIDIASLFDCATAMLREDEENERKIEAGEYR